jgi:tungstate transport system ATP-binding protein
MPEGLPPQAAAALSGVRVSARGQVLLDGVDLDLPGHGVSALMGPNGAGKSLTLRVLAGLIAPEAGSVTLAPEVEGRVALVFQTPVVLRRSLRANLDHALWVHGVPRRERPGRIADLLARGGLEALADRPARRLSGGERQRLAMMRALAAEPRLLLLDEPTASLDPRSTALIEEMVRAAVADGIAVALVTHDRGQAQRLADRVVLMHRGRVAERAPAASFFEAPASEEGRAYLDGRLLI